MEHIRDTARFSRNRLNISGRYNDIRRGSVSGNRHSPHAADMRRNLREFRRFKGSRLAEILNLHQRSQRPVVRPRAHIDMLEIIESIIQQIYSLQIILIGAVSMKKHAHQPLAVPLSVGYQRIPGHLGEAGLTACTPARIVVCIALQHLMMIREIPCLLVHIRRRNLILDRAAHSTERLIRVGCLGDQRHIMSGSVVIIRVES